MMTCPRCGESFRHSIGTHAMKCGVSMPELFWTKVDKNGPNGCWIWKASRKEKGYGQFFYRGRMYRAHRLAWQMFGRPLPSDGMELGHSCDNRLCVNPDHLRPMTHAENMAECKARGRTRNKHMERVYVEPPR